MQNWRTLLGAAALWLAQSGSGGAVEPIHVGFLWHMHQPIYYPGETVTETDAAGHFSFSQIDVHNQRFGPYTTWPRDAVAAGLSLPHLGAQVSFSGSLIQNLNDLRAAGAGGGMWNNWESAYRQAGSWTTAEGNPRLDLVNFGFNHPLMPLLDERDIRMQLRLQREIHEQTWGPDVPFSKGIFPPETAFSTRIIPALVAEGIEWTLVDNIHFDRATINYPHTNASNLFAPNRADQINPDPAAGGGAWVQLNNLWAPSQVSAPFSYQPHHVQHVDPHTGEISKIVAVPAARYEGNEDGRGGYGAFLYDQVMDAYLPYNTDPDHPMLVVLHHDGDNFGGGTEAYYHHNFQNMVNWVSNDADYDATTIQDYLDRFPVDPGDVIHVESGSWAGADNGDPEFQKWLGDPGPDGWSPDRNSWAVLTAAKNHVFTADDIAPVANLQNVINGTGTPTERAWHYLLQAEASDHWYWDGTEVWDSNVTRGSNLAVAAADHVLDAYVGEETTAPSVFLPQRESYNPGGFEWSSQPEPSDFEVWTFAYDVSGLADVTLHWRVDGDGFNPLDSIQNETYAGGPETGNWNSVTMTSSDVPPPASILTPTQRAQRYGAMIEGQEDVLIDYFVEAIDLNGNVAQSDIQHVYVGSSVPPGGETMVTIGPDPAQAGEPVTISYDPTGGPLSSAEEVYLHYGFDNWNPVVSTDPLMNWDAENSLWSLTVPVISSATQLDIVFNGAGVWDNNDGQDWHFAVVGAEPAIEFEMDGVLDESAQVLIEQQGRHLYVAHEGDQLYVATEDAGEGYDVFIYLAAEPGSLTAANWAKEGQVAQWDAYLADENDNGFAQWFDAAGTTDSATGANGGVLEGVINLVDEFGTLPAEVYLAVGLFETTDGGALNSALQLPISVNGDGNIDAGEFVLLRLITRLAGDYDGDGVVGAGDYTVWRDTLGSTTDLRADGSGNGRVGPEDHDFWFTRFGNGAADSAALAAQAPEPAALMLAMALFLLLLAIRRGVL